MTQPAVLYPDTVSVVTAYLQAVLDADTTHTYADGAKVRTREPNPFLPPLVTVRRVGGPDAVVIDRPRIDIQVWHTDEADATDLANLVRAHMLAIPGVHSGVTVYRITTFSGPTLIWDEDRNLPRYLLTFELGVRGTAL
jgi:hypothetical protein